MKQVFNHYSKWEDYIHGMYDLHVKNEFFLINSSIRILSNPLCFESICKEILQKWVISSQENLTNKFCNRRAWLGQAACCYACGSPEYITRKAWSFLSKQQQHEANLIAEKIINHFELTHGRIDKEIYF